MLLSSLKSRLRQRSDGFEHSGDSRDARRWLAASVGEKYARGMENMNVIYLRSKGRETGLPVVETTFQLVHCLLLSLFPLQAV